MILANYDTRDVYCPFCKDICNNVSNCAMRDNETGACVFVSRSCQNEYEFKKLRHENETNLKKIREELAYINIRMGEHWKKTAKRNNT